MTTHLFNHTSQETALVVDNYPYGFRLRTQIRYWIETTPKKGDRFCSQTRNPKITEREVWNAPKKSTYSQLMVLARNEDNGHIGTTSLSIYSKPEQVQQFIDEVKEVNLNKDQKTILNQLRGVQPVIVDEFTGVKKKDFSVKWDYELIGQGWKDGKYNKGEKGKCDEVKITFDRPDGVKLREIFNAMKSLNQDKLNEVFESRPSLSSGERTGVVRICTRGGYQLGTVSEEEYKNFLASDSNVLEESAHD